jgi:hypothetical protein
MPKGTVISHAEALRPIDAQVGETVYVGFLVARADPDDPEDPAPFVHSVGPLKNMLAPKPPRLERDVGFYELGRESLYLPPIAGTIHLSDNGLDFRVADTVLIRVAWRGSKEVGNPWSNPTTSPRSRRRQSTDSGCQPTSRRRSNAAIPSTWSPRI